MFPTRKNSVIGIVINITHLLCNLFMINELATSRFNYLTSGTEVRLRIPASAPLLSHKDVPLGISYFS